MQELPGRETQCRPSRNHVDEQSPDRQHALHGEGVGSGSARVGQHGRQVGFGPGHRRCPVNARDLGSLLCGGVGQQAGSCGNHVRLAA